MDIQVCIMLDKCVYRHQKGICPHVQCVVRACRTFLSCSVRQKRASSRAQCAKNVHPLVLCVFFFTFFFLKPPTACRTPSKREKKKPALVSRSHLVSCLPKSPTLCRYNDGPNRLKDYQIALFA